MRGADHQCYGPECGAWRRAPNGSDDARHPLATLVGRNRCSSGSGPRAKPKGRRMHATTALLAEIDEFMEFSVGDHVAMVQGGLFFEEALLMRPPVRLVIVERIIRQCSGGVQASYVVRLFNPQGGSAFTEFHRHELIPHADGLKEYEERRKAQKAERG